MRDYRAVNRSILSIASGLVNETSGDQLWEYLGRRKSQRCQEQYCSVLKLRHNFLLFWHGDCAAATI